ncbi:MAG: multicopper oxidase domain-containing protein [Rhodobacterales bacterium]|nr:multicopper oxidase domain-containing protein [Rhodobacterales bacterium]
MIALLALLACQNDPAVDTSPNTSAAITTTTTTTQTTVVTSTTAPALPFANPIEAIDQNPDAQIFETTLTAASHTHWVNGQTIDGYAYNGQTPGPTLRLTVGDTLRVHLDNQLTDPTTLHWHGLSVPWEMDGVTWMQAPVEPGETFLYEFVVERAGTFWYHPHFDSASQVDLGLYGVIVVEDPNDPTFDNELVAVFDSWGEQDAEQGHAHAPDPTARTWTVNSLVQPLWQPDAGTATRVRMLNVANAGYLSLLDVEHIGGDQGLLSHIAGVSDVLLGPGDRADILLRHGADALTLQSEPYAAAGGVAWGSTIALFDVRPQGALTAPPAPTWATSGALPSADPGYADITWVLQGEGDDWRINGETFPNVTIPETRQGTPTVIELRNLSAAEHPFHLHGSAFEVLSIDGQAPSHLRMEDTINVPIRSTIRLLLSPERTGDWMSHCHILPHAEEGMMTVLRVLP